jgi:hypothetical protein
MAFLTYVAGKPAPLVRNWTLAAPIGHGIHVSGLIITDTYDPDNPDPQPYGFKDPVPFLPYFRNPFGRVVEWPLQRLVPSWRAAILDWLVQGTTLSWPAGLGIAFIDDHGAGDTGEPYDGAAVWAPTWDSAVGSETYWPSGTGHSAVYGGYRVGNSSQLDHTTLVSAEPFAAVGFQDTGTGEVIALGFPVTTGGVLTLNKLTTVWPENAYLVTGASYSDPNIPATLDTGLGSTASATDYTAATLIGGLIGGTNPSPPGAWWLGIGNFQGDDAWGGNYARQSITFGAASGGVAANTSNHVWHPDTAWGPDGLGFGSDYAFVADAATGGNILMRWAVNFSRIDPVTGDTIWVQPDETVTITAGQLVVGII